MYSQPLIFIGTKKIHRGVIILPGKLPEFASDAANCVKSILVA